MRLRTFLVVFFTSAVSLSGDCVSEEILLFPINGYGPGANGSRWTFAAPVLNSSDQPLTSPGVHFVTQCFIPEGCPSLTVPPHEFASIDGPLATTGIVVHLSKTQAEEVVAAFRVYELSSQSAVDIPVVRSKDFRTGALWLLFVPVDNTSRTALRIYQPDGRVLQVRLSILSVTGRALTSVDLVVSLPSIPDQILCATPSGTTVTLQNLFPQIARENGFVNLKIEPLPPVERFWAFASVTNNRTNLVQLISPN